jgi:hypothetical protein
VDIDRVEPTRARRDSPGDPRPVPDALLSRGLGTKKTFGRIQTGQLRSHPFVTRCKTNEDQKSAEYEELDFSFFVGNHDDVCEGIAYPKIVLPELEAGLLKEVAHLLARTNQAWFSWMEHDFSP